jgi:hypothetical protein
VDVADVLAATGAREHRVLAGKLVRKHLSFPERAIVPALRVPEGDFRDWAEIRRWAAGIAGALPTGTGGTAQARRWRAPAGPQDHPPVVLPVGAQRPGCGSATGRRPSGRPTCGRCWSRATSSWAAATPGRSSASRTRSTSHGRGTNQGSST